jgi:hypothetical protein
MAVDVGESNGLTHNPCARRIIMSMSFHQPVTVGPLRWLVLTRDGQVTTFLFFVKSLYTPFGAGTTLFVQSDVDTGNEGQVQVQGQSQGLRQGQNPDPDNKGLFAVFGDNLEVARFLRDEVWNYTVFAGRDGREPAPVVEARFESLYEFPQRMEERMLAPDGTEVILSFEQFGKPYAYQREVNERLREVGSLAVPERFRLTINGHTPAGSLEMGPLNDAPPIGADLQNLWFQVSELKV